MVAHETPSQRQCQTQTNVWYLGKTGEVLSRASRVKGVAFDLHVRKTPSFLFGWLISSHQMSKLQYPPGWQQPAAAGCCYTATTTAATAFSCYCTQLRTAIQLQWQWCHSSSTTHESVTFWYQPRPEYLMYNARPNLLFYLPAPETVIFLSIS